MLTLDRRRKGAKMDQMDRLMDHPHGIRPISEP